MSLLGTISTPIIISIGPIGAAERDKNMNFVKFNLLLVCFLRSADVAFKSAEV
jgi:hypothetical protein